MTVSIELAAPTTAEVADLLDKAEAHLERVGLHKGWLYDEAKADAGTDLADVPVCMVGAVLAAAYGVPRYPSAEPSKWALTDAAIIALTDTVGQPVHVWSDAKPRQKRQAIKVIRDTAAALREAAA